MIIDRGLGYGMAGGTFTDVIVHSSKFYHQEHATEPCRNGHLERCNFKFTLDLPICISSSL